MGHYPKKRTMILRGGLFCLCMSVILLYNQTRARPYNLHPYEPELIEAANWIRSEMLLTNPIRATHVRFYYAVPLMIPHTDVENMWASPTEPDLLPVGTIAVWDGKYSEIFSLKRSALERPGSGWERNKTFGDQYPVHIYQKVR